MNNNLLSYKTKSVRIKRVENFPQEWLLAYPIYTFNSQSLKLSINKVFVVVVDEVCKCLNNESQVIKHLVFQVSWTNVGCVQQSTQCMWITYIRVLTLFLWLANIFHSISLIHKYSSQFNRVTIANIYISYVIYTFVFLVISVLL